MVCAPPLHSRMELSPHLWRVLACLSCRAVEGSEPHPRVDAECALGSTYTERGVDLETRDLGMDGKEALFGTISIRGRPDCKLPVRGEGRGGY